jgi:hypothetical protein
MREFLCSSTFGGRHPNEKPPTRRAALANIESVSGENDRRSARSRTALCVIVQVPDRSLEKRSRYLQALLFMWGTFLLDHVIEISKNEGIHPSSGKLDLEFSRAMIHDFCFRDWCVLFRVRSNSVEDLLFQILAEGSMLSSLPWLV